MPIATAPLRGMMLDPFGYTRERALIDRYERAVASFLDGLDHPNHALAVETASLPERTPASVT